MKKYKKLKVYFIDKYYFYNISITNFMFKTIYLLTNNSKWQLKIIMKIL